MNISLSPKLHSGEGLCSTEKVDILMRAYAVIVVIVEDAGDIRSVQ